MRKNALLTAKLISEDFPWVSSLELTAQLTLKQRALRDQRLRHELPGSCAGNLSFSLNSFTLCGDRICEHWGLRGITYSYSAFAITFCARFSVGGKACNIYSHNRYKVVNDSLSIPLDLALAKSKLQLITNLCLCVHKGLPEFHRVRVFRLKDLILRAFT